MSRSQLPLNALRAFEAAARHASFTHAAEELHVTQAAVSHQVKALEERLGVALFVRRPRGLEITGEGQALLPDLRDAFDRMTNALERVGRKANAGTLNVSLVTTFALGWLAPRLHRFQAKHPEIEVRMTTAHAARRLRARGFRLRHPLRGAARTRSARHAAVQRRADAALRQALQGQAQDARRSEARALHRHDLRSRMVDLAARRRHGRLQAQARAHLRSRP